MIWAVCTFYIYHFVGNAEQRTPCKNVLCIAGTHRSTEQQSASFSWCVMGSPLMQCMGLLYTCRAGRDTLPCEAKMFYSQAGFQRVLGIVKKEHHADCRLVETYARETGCRCVTRVNAYPLITHVAVELRSTIWTTYMMQLTFYLEPHLLYVYMY